VGAQGIISVASNWIPGPVAQLTQLVRAKKFVEAKALHNQLAEIFKVLFIEPNPVPVKHLMQRAKIIESAEVRLPLCEMSDSNRKLVESTADAYLSSIR
jgi:4-hydroxy-tetrahydrodipicolinate synthase